MTRREFVKMFLVVVFGGMSGAVLARSAQVLRPRPAATPTRIDFTRFTNAELLGAYHQAQQPSDFAGDTLVIWMDYACPSCATLYHQIKQALFSRNKLRIVYRNFPLPSHATAFDLAITVEAAEEQDHGDTMRDWIFEHRGYGEDGKESCLKLIGVEERRWKQDCVAARSRVTSDNTEARGFGVSGTPTLILLSADPPREVFLKELTHYKQAA